MMRHLGALVTGLVVVLGTAAAAPRLEAQSFVVVVNEANPVTAISRDELSRMFLKKITVWRTKRIAFPVDQRESSRIRGEFTRSVHRREVTSVASYWQQQIFAGRAVPPAQRMSDADVMSLVASNPDAIGYVSTNAAIGTGVKVVAIR